MNKKPKGVRYLATRGQTLPDFAIATAIFLLVIVFVVAFIPQITVPYDEQETPAVADRIGADLKGQLLTEPGQSTDIDERCTIAFFQHLEGDDCLFKSNTTLNDQLGVSDRYSVNITLRENLSDGPQSAILCGDNGTIDTCGTDRLTRGSDIPGSDRSVSTSRHVVNINGTYTTIEVKVWI